MKYNPRACNRLAMLPGFLARHPYAPEPLGQGFLACLYELQEMLKEVTGMRGVSLTPTAGAQGEFAGVAMIRAYHLARGDLQRTEILVPDAAHGTNPATATMCGYTVREIPTDAEGDVDLAALRAGGRSADRRASCSPIPPPSGVFERRILDIARVVHEAGGLLYYDGANLNAILGKVRPGDMGFDVIHMNLHKTFSTPHGGGGPGAGPVGVGERLLPFLPVPVVGHDGSEYHWITERERPQSIGRLSAFMGNAGVLLRAYVYARMLGREGMERVADYSTLNANYLMVKLAQSGFDLAFPGRRATHEFIVTLKRQARELGVHTVDFAKASAGLWLPCADHLFPAAHSGVPADRADRDRSPRGAGRLRRRLVQDPRGGREQSGSAEERAAHPAGAQARRCAGGARAGPALACAGSQGRLSCGRPMASQGARGVERIVKAFGYSWSGFKAAFAHEEAFRQEFALFMVGAPLGLWLGNTGVERALLVGSLLLVLIVELLNTAVEVVVDRIGDDHHALSGRAKDLGSAAVLVSIIHAAVVWWLVLLP